MTLADYSFGAFALLNTARLFGYFPQIVRVHRDDSGAKAVSVFTWLLFSAANIATVSYAMIVSHDAVMATIFALNAVGCLTIVGLTMWRRAGIRKTRADDGGSYGRLSGVSSEKIPRRAKSRGPQTVAQVADWMVFSLLRRSARSRRRGVPSVWSQRHSDRAV